MILVFFRLCETLTSSVPFTYNTHIHIFMGFDGHKDEVCVFTTAVNKTINCEKWLKWLK